MSDCAYYCRKYLLGASSAVALLSSMPAFAQTVVADNAAPEVVTVTVERQATNIQTTPLAITAVSGDALAQSNVVQLSDINGIVPSLSIARSAGFETVVTIRGVGLETPENSLTTSPGVATFIDGAYIANSITLDQTLFDIDHVEVLRGPQGALYGQSATGGAILLVTRQASLDGGLSGDVSGSYGTFNLHREDIEINAPLTDTLAVHFAGEQFEHNGFTGDPLIPGYKADNADDLQGKLDVLWQPTSDFSIRLSSESYHAYQNEAAQKNIDDPDPNPWEITQDYPSKFDMATNVSHATLEWDGPGFTIQSITAYQWLQNKQGEDSSRSAFSLLGAYDDVAAWDTSLVNYNEELDFRSNDDSPLQWDFGMFLLSQKSSQFVEEFECAPTYGPCAAPTPAALAIVSPYSATLPSNLDYGNQSEVDRKSWSFFGQSTYHFTDAFSITGGLRLNADEYTDTSHNFSAFGNDIVINSSLDHVWTYRLEADYQLTPQEMLYVSTNRGYKPGGVNGIYGQSYYCSSPFTYGGCNTNEPLLIPNEFKPEVNTAYEIGSKNQWFDNHLTANFAGFYYFYHDMQYLATDPVPFDGGIVNIPSTHMYGFETEAHYLGWDDHLHLNGDLSIENGSIQGVYKTLDSTTANAIEASAPACAFSAYYYYPGCWATVVASARNVGGNPPAKMPRFLGSFDASYDFKVLDGTLTPRAQVIYRGDYWARVFDEPALDKVPAYTMVNLNLDYVPDNGPFKLSLLCSNVGNIAGVNNRYTDPYGTGQTSEQYTPPRQVIGTITYNF